MKPSCKQNLCNAGLLILFCLIAVQTTAYSASLNTKNRVYKHYSLDINLFSVNPNQPLDSYKFHGSGGSGDGGTVGLSYADKSKHFMVNVAVANSKSRFVVQVDVVPRKQDTGIEADSFEVDFTDMKPRSFELTRNEDDRVCILNLTPSIKIVDNRPKRADDTSFEFSRWVLLDSMVIFNDSIYVGKTGCSGGPLAYVSYPGLAKVEFALEPFRAAKPLGTLKDGRIQIRSEDGQSLDIYGVKNGVHSIKLPGGPYQVWVRWQNLPGEAKFEMPPKEEWIRMVKAQFAEMGNTPPTDEELDKGYERTKHENHLPLSCGIGPIKPADRVDN